MILPKVIEDFVENRLSDGHFSVQGKELGKESTMPDEQGYAEVWMEQIDREIGESNE